MKDQNKTVCFFWCQIGFSLFSELAISFQWEELATYASTSWQSHTFLAGGRRTYLGKGCRRPTWSLLPTQVTRSALSPWREMQYVSPVVPALQKVKLFPTREINRPGIVMKDTPGTVAFWKHQEGECWSVSLCYSALKETMSMVWDLQETTKYCIPQLCSFGETVMGTWANVHGDIPKCLQALCMPLSVPCARRSRADTSSPF